MDEKTKIFPEIVPHSHTSMTDVFGNYVIQKFFEHGTEIPRKAPASELTGHVPPLSLQMPQLLYLRMNSGSFNLLRVVVLKLEATSKDLALAS